MEKPIYLPLMFLYVKDTFLCVVLCFISLFCPFSESCAMMKNRKYPFWYMLKGLLMPIPVPKWLCKGNTFPNMRNLVIIEIVGIVVIFEKGDFATSLDDDIDRSPCMGIYPFLNNSDSLKKSIFKSILWIMSFHFIKKIGGFLLLNSKVGSLSSILIFSLRDYNPFIAGKNLLQHCCCPSTNMPFRMGSNRFIVLLIIVRRSLKDLVHQVLQGRSRVIRGNVVCHIERGVFCLLSFVFCLLSFVFCLLSFVFCLLSFVFCLLSFFFFQRKESSGLIKLD